MLTWLTVIIKAHIGLTQELLNKVLRTKLEIYEHTGLLMQEKEYFSSFRCSWDDCDSCGHE